MIGQVTRHGRTKRDSKNLQNHLEKDPLHKVEVLNSVASNLSEVLSDMSLFMDGTKVNSAFLHISLSPGRDMTDEELKRVAEIVMKHFNAEKNQSALIIHEKDRAGGKGNRHAHLVLGRVSHDGEIVSAGFEKIRLETAMRIAEFELNEPCVLGRHHASSLKWLKANGRDDVAQFMQSSYGSNPEKPSSAASPDKRQKLERKGIILADVNERVRRAWEGSDNGRSFASALSEVGMSFQKGQKNGVYIVKYGDQEIGSLDRLLKEKRGAVKSKIGEYEYESAAENNANAGDERYLQREQGQQIRSRDIETIIDAPRGARTAARGTHRADTASFRGGSVGAKASHDNDRGFREKGGRFKQKTSLIELDKIRLSNNTVIAAQCIKTHKIRKVISNFEFQSAFKLIENRTSGWEFIRFLKDDLMCKIKEVHEKYFKRPEPVRGVFTKKNAEKSIYKNHEKILVDEPANMKFG